VVGKNFLTRVTPCGIFTKSQKTWDGDYE